jgi:hypothetical protein
MVPKSRDGAVPLSRRTAPVGQLLWRHELSALRLTNASPFRSIWCVLGLLPVSVMPWHSSAESQAATGAPALISEADYDHFRAARDDDRRSRQLGNKRVDNRRYRAVGGSSTTPCSPFDWLDGGRLRRSDPRLAGFDRTGPRVRRPAGSPIWAALRSDLPGRLAQLRNRLWRLLPSRWS